MNIEHGPAIELHGIDKRFGAVHANRDITLTIRKGTIHGIVGENGAGKSTLMSILYGFYQADRGEIRINGVPRVISDSQTAIRLGIGMVHQHFMLVDTFTVLENITLGAEGGALLHTGAKDARAELDRLEKDYALEVGADAVVETLAVGLQQRVEILKALYRGADILILDEPTGVLTPQEADHLFRILRELRDQGKTVILITHKLREIMAVTDQVSVMRQGAMVAHRETVNTSVEELAELMVGRHVSLVMEKTTRPPGEVVLEVDRLSMIEKNGVQSLKDVSLTVREGEIVGVAGVSGNGQSELLAAIAGIRPASSGELRLRGKTISSRPKGNPKSLRRMGMAHVPEDRSRMGLVLPFAANESAVLGYQDDPVFAKGPLLNHPAMVRDTATKMGNYDIRPPDPQLKTANFSGGNQQKIVLAREMERDPDLLLIGQPTRGVDIGAIEFIHKRVVEMRDSGKAILLVSVELDEIRTLADRILVMFDGRIVGELASAEADEQTLGLMMAGINNAPAEVVH